MSKKEKNKPDQVADNPGLLPYGSNVGAPAIKTTDIGAYKQEKLNKSNKYLKAKYDEIKQEYLDLIEAAKWNELVYTSDFKWEPIKGETYYLYQQPDESLFLSIIEPEYWNQIFIGAFRLNSNDIWEKIG